MAPIQLADRKQVECRHQCAHPSRKCHRMEDQIKILGSSPKHRVAQYFKKKWLPKNNTPLFRNMRDRFRQRKPIHQCRQRQHKPGQRPCHPHVEKLLLARNGRPDLNKRPHRPDRTRRRKRNKIRESGIDPIKPARQIVPHLMGQ